MKQSITEVTGVIDRKAREYIAAHPGTSYNQAVVETLRADGDLAAEYAAVSHGPGLALKARGGKPNGKAVEDISDELDTRTREHMKNSGETDYRKALHAVLQSDRDLARRYNEGVAA